MNNKSRTLYEIVDKVVECCTTEIDEGSTISVTAESVLGPSRVENVLMTRCICVMVLYGAGFSVTTIAQLFKRTPHAIRHLLEVDRNFRLTSRAYRIASAEATIACKDIGGDCI